MLHFPLVAGSEFSELPWKAVCGVHVADPGDLDDGLCTICSSGGNLSVEDALDQLDNESQNGLISQESVRDVMDRIDPADQYNLNMEMVKNDLRVTNAAVNIIDREEPEVGGQGDSVVGPINIFDSIGQDGLAEENNDPDGTTELDYFKPRRVEGKFGLYLKTDLPDPSPWGKHKVSYESNAGAGILLYCPDDETVWLAKRADEDVSEPGQWNVPGGGVDPSDSSPGMAAVRECNEEIGGLPDHVEPAGQAVFQDGNFIYTTYLMNVSAGDKRRWTPILNAEHSDCGWFHVDDLPQPQHFGMQTIIDEFPQVFDLSLNASPSGNNLVDLTVAEVRSPLGPDTSTAPTTWGWKRGDSLIQGPSEPFRSEPGRWTESYHDINQFEDLDKLGCKVAHTWAYTSCACCTGLHAITPRLACTNCSGIGRLKLCIKCGQVVITKKAMSLRWLKRADAVKQVKQFGQIPVHVEWRKGETRQGVGTGGVPWERLMHCDYGFIPGTVGDDEEPIDVYLGGSNNPVAYVVNQLNRDGSPDEKKVMLGFESPEMAEAMYRTHYPKNGEGFFGGMEVLGVDSFINKYFPQTSDPYKIELEADATNQEWLDTHSTKTEEVSKASSGQSLRDQAKHDPAMVSKLKGFTTPGSDMHGFAQANPDFPADKVLKGMVLPPGINTLGDVQEALLAKPEPKKKKQGPVPLPLSDKAKPKQEPVVEIPEPTPNEIVQPEPSPTQEPKTKPEDQTGTKPARIPQQVRTRVDTIPKNLQNIDTKEVKTPAEIALEKSKSPVQQVWNQAWDYLGGNPKRHGSFEDMTVASVGIISVVANEYAQPDHGPLATEDSPHPVEDNVVMHAEIDLGFSHD